MSGAGWAPQGAGAARVHAALFPRRALAYLTRNDGSNLCPVAGGNH